MVHRHHAIALHHSVVGRQLFLREGGVVRRRFCELLAHKLGCPVVVLAAACDAGNDERHGALSREVRCVCIRKVGTLF
jgi:hypothetical protein